MYLNKGKTRNYVKKKSINLEAISLNKSLFIKTLIYCRSIVEYLNF